MSKSTKILLTFFIIVFVSFLFLPTITLAARDLNQYKPDFAVKFGQTEIPLTAASCPGGQCTIGWIGDYIGALYKYGVGLAAVLSTIMIMVGGFLWLTSAGSPDRVGKAKEFITSALTGLVLALFSFMILYTVNPEIVKLKPLGVKEIAEVNFPESVEPESLPEESKASDKLAAIDQECEYNLDLIIYDCDTIFGTMRDYRDYGGGEFYFEIPATSSQQEAENRWQKKESLMRLLSDRMNIPRVEMPGRFVDWGGFRFRFNNDDPSNIFWEVRNDPLSLFSFY